MDFNNPRPVWTLLSLLVLTLPIEALVRPTSLPDNIHNCYNNYANTTLRDVVGENFCYFCEDRAIHAMTPPVQLSPRSARANRYISELVEDVHSIKSRGRTKRQTMLRPCRRREYRMLSDAERNRFHNGLNTLKRNGNYDALASLHSGLVANTAHGGPNFFSWHRVFVLLLELALRRIDPRICIPYWNSAFDNELPNPRASYVFSPDFLGGRQNGPVTDGPFAGWGMPWGVPLIRNIGATGQLFSARAIRNVMRQRRTFQICPPFANLNNDLEFQHGGVHNYIGGQMRPLRSAAFDPVFFLHHCFVDYLWETFRNRQRALGIDPQADYPRNPGSPLHAADVGLGFGFNLTALDGYSNAIASFAQYDPSPTCNRNRPACGSRYLECNIDRGSCVPRTPPRNCQGQGCRTPRAIRDPSSPSLPPAPQPCMSNVIAIQNDYCIDGKCDIRKWVFVGVNVVSIRPPGFNSYRSYPVVNGEVETRYDIYQPSAYADTAMFSSPTGSAPKQYEKCDKSNGIGQVFVEATGMTYNGYYKESSLIDQRLATGMSITYVAVKNPQGGPVKALFRAFDSCGRLCKPTCRIPGTKQYKACSGAMEISHVPGHPNQYSHSYGQASANIWNLGPEADCPILDDQGIALTFYCDYTDRIPWTSASAYIGHHHSGPASANQTSLTGSRRCRVDHDCRLSVPCDSGPCSEGDVHRCRGSCTKYAECTHGQYRKRQCPVGTSFDQTTMSCVPGLSCSIVRPARRPETTPNDFRHISGGRQSQIGTGLGGQTHERGTVWHGIHQQPHAVGHGQVGPDIGTDPYVTDPYAAGPDQIGPNIGQDPYVTDPYGPGMHGSEQPFTADVFESGFEPGSQLHKGLSKMGANLHNALHQIYDFNGIFESPTRTGRA